MALPTQFSEREAELKKKQMIAQMLLAQGMQQPGGQMVSGHYVAPSAIAHLAPLAQAFMGNRMQGKVEEGQASLKNDYQKALAEQLTAYKTAAAENPEAARDYMTSEFDPVKQMATADYERLQKAMAPKVINDKLVSWMPQENKANVLYDGAGKYSPVQTVATTPDGRELLGQIEEGSNQVRVLPGQGKGIEINTGDTADSGLAKAIGPQIMKRLDKSYESANQKRDSVRSLDSATEDLTAGINSGIAAEVTQGLNKVYSLFTGKEVDPAVVNTEAFQNNMKRQVAAVAKSLGPAPTDADREFLKQMSGADVTLEPEAILRLLKLAKADAYNSMMDHQGLVDKARNSFQTSPALQENLNFYSMDLPEVGNTPESGDVYYDEKLKRYRVSPTQPKRTAPQADGVTDQYQGVKPVGTNAQGMPQYRLEDLMK